MSDEVRTHAGERVLRLPEVQQRVGGVSKSSIYSWIKAGFPAPVKIGPAGAVSVWRASEVDAWLTEQLARTRE